MTSVELVAKAGGLFAVFVFIHFVADWIFQSHDEAMVKHRNSYVRAKHCLIYTAFFLPVLALLDISGVGLLVSGLTLFISHYIEDTYVPVFLWAKYIRRPPGMDGDATKAFYNFVETPLGKILMIAVDQIIHLAFLFVPVAFLL